MTVDDAEPVVVDTPLLTPEALHDPEVRRALSAPAVRLFLKVCDLWDLKIDQRRAVLGGISKQSYHNWKSGHVAALTRDQLERISLVLGILKGLRLVFAEDQHAFEWLKAETADTPFNGRAPLAVMEQGGITDLFEVRRYLDAWRGVK